MNGNMKPFGIFIADELNENALELVHGGRRPIGTDTSCSSPTVSGSFDTQGQDDGFSLETDDAV